MRAKIQASVDEYHQATPQPDWAKRNREAVAAAKRQKAAREAEAVAWLAEVKSRKKGGAK